MPTVVAGGKPSSWLAANNMLLLCLFPRDSIRSRSLVRQTKCQLDPRKQLAVAGIFPTGLESRKILPLIKISNIDLISSPDDLPMPARRFPPPTLREPHDQSVVIAQIRANAIEHCFGLFARRVVIIGRNHHLGERSADPRRQSQCRLGERSADPRRQSQCRDSSPLGGLNSNANRRGGLR